MPKRYGKQTTRLMREARQTVRGLAHHGLVEGTMRSALLDIGFSPEEAARLANAYQRDQLPPKKTGPKGASS